MITGKVQGVFFRASARERAQEKGITGWVRNTDEGHVEIMASGSESDLEQFIAWCRSGPRGAVVTDVNITQVAELEFEKFSIVRG